MKNNNWIYKVFLLTFLLSVLFSVITNIIAYNTSLIIMFLILVLVICIGIIFDMLGTASLTCKEPAFHAMNAQKVSGAKEAIDIIKNNVRFASLCNDVIGDICGIVSGGLGAVIALNISTKLNINVTLISTIVAAFISAFTVGGKAIFKTVAVKKCNEIIYFTAKIKKTFKFKKN